MRTQHLTNAAIALAFTLALPACGSDDSPTPSPTPQPGTGTIAATVTISAQGVAPATVTVPAGSRVTFQNNHTLGHAPASDPHPTHGSCPALDQIGTIPAGQSRTSGNLNTPGTCRYHDHDTTNPIFNGTIIVQ